MGGLERILAGLWGVPICIRGESLLRAKLKPVGQEVLILLALGLGENPELLRIVGEDRTVIPMFLKTQVN